MADDDGDIEWESDHDDEEDHDDHDLDNAEADFDDVVDQATNAAGNAQDRPNTNRGDFSNILHVLTGLNDRASLDMLGQEVEDAMEEHDGLHRIFSRNSREADFTDDEDEEGDELDENDEDDAPYQTLEGMFFPSYITIPH